ncbi:MAG: SDR family oxidoreductase [Bacteroidota bacterium]
MHISLSQQTILVTGGSRGIGRAIVRRLAASGATVAVQYGQSKAAAESLQSEFPEQVHVFQADFRKPDAPWQLAEQVLNQLGQIDGLVNNAGIALEMPTKANSQEWQTQWETTLQVNLIATAALCRAFLPTFQQQQQGRIVHISSRAAFRGDTVDYLAYAASKGGMVALSRSLARGYGKMGIKSFVVAPGFIRTEMAQQFIDTYGEAWVLDDLALNKLTEPEDVAPTVEFLLSGLMDHATGCTIDINAGSYVH